jgi:hypothetical protein
MRENVFAGSIITAISPFWKRLVDLVRLSPRVEYFTVMTDPKR